MSIDAMRWAKRVKTGKSSAKAVLTWLADMCGADLCAFPSIPALAEATELDKKTVQSSLQHLVSVGLIEDTGERRGRTRQIPVYRLVGVDESVNDAEHTQKREHYQKRDRLNTPKNGGVSANTPKNGCFKNNQRHPFFPLNDPKNGIRNLPEEPKDLTPTHNAREKSEVQPKVRAVPDYPDQPGMIFPAVQMIGKFPINPGWMPSPDFKRQAALWGMSIREGINLTAELNNFIAYWQAEGKVFHQVQWEQKFARHLQRAGQPTSRGNQNAGAESGSTANRAVQQIRAARAQRLRARGEGVEILGNDGRDLLQPLDYQKRIGAVGPMDCSDWEFDQRPDDERV